MHKIKLSTHFSIVFISIMKYNVFKGDGNEIEYCIF